MPRRCSSALAAGLAAVLALGACATPSVMDEQQLSRRFEAEVRAQYRLVTDDVVVEYVERIGQRIVAAAGPQPFAYEFAVIDDPEINAFAGPAGHVYVNTGTILGARTVAELAGVVAHEVGHVVERHVAENYGKQRAANVGRQAAVLGGGLVFGQAGATAASLATGLGLATVLNSFGREAEREADDFAVQVLPRAGYDPNGLPSFFETMIAQGGPSAPTFLSSHPAPEDRLEATRAAIEAQALPAGLRTDDGGRLEIIQRRIELLTGESAPRAPGQGRR
jgi:predicted Zn-dependent protease